MLKQILLQDEQDIVMYCYHIFMICEPVYL